ncbi:hypothetical protein HNQ68_000114 [Pseudochrobactrum saccharolyticum]|uniref:DUF721 domain-containing protein n=1 Tax=Pseudochrobactrum saccharolyticum TaxID=354352 RepID=A0A7W8AFN6_9HYPH|nr:DciA family protein [Pseudochrobactrum saccharolyticum]KAB0540113.1 DUF721 domain-containing protein [Pseudochrobactrum saccharolyticum]MBB5089602.1 hypothetical protein [Pseudochrobactrum saccharolyticum]
MSREEKSGFKPLADTAGSVLDPVLRKRAGINLSLIQAWEDVVGPQIGAQSRPLRILWPRRAHEDDPFQPATLIIGCEGMAAMRIQHSTGEIINRVNSFLGFVAIARIRIEQKSVAPVAQRKIKTLMPVGAPAEKKLAQATVGIEDEALRASLMQLGRNILAEKANKKPR